jgi:dTDP-4-amino-4,6-dideoxygalactose transaminase
MPVELFGNPSEVDLITEIAHSENIKVLIDSAQSFGATSKNRRVGTLGDATTTSFFPAKPLGCYGDGGAIFTEDDELAERVNSIRLHGKGSEKYDNVRIGLNSRLDTIQAAILIEKLKLFKNELVMRQKIANIYNDSLAQYCKIPILDSNTTSAWAQYTIIVDNRDELQSSLKSLGIPSIVYYPIPLSKQKGYEHYPCVSSGTNISERLSKSVLSLPMHPYLDIDAQNNIIKKVIEGLNKK